MPVTAEPVPFAAHETGVGHRSSPVCERCRDKPPDARPPGRIVHVLIERNPYRRQCPSGNPTGNSILHGWYRPDGTTHRPHGQTRARNARQTPCLPPRGLLIRQACAARRHPARAKGLGQPIFPPPRQMKRPSTSRFRPPAPQTLRGPPAGIRPQAPARCAAPGRGGEIESKRRTAGNPQQTSRRKRGGCGALTRDGHPKRRGSGAMKRGIISEIIKCSSHFLKYARV